MRIKYAVSTDEQIPTAIHITHITATTAQISPFSRRCVLLTDANPPDILASPSSECISAVTRR